MPNLTEIAAAIEKKAGEIATKKAAFISAQAEAKAVIEAAQATAKAAEQAYLATLSDIRELHEQYKAVIKDVLSADGTLHVAGV